MPKTRAQKKEVVAHIVDKLGRMKSMVFVDFTGVNTKDINELRDKCREGAEYCVAKKTLIDVALAEAAAQGKAFSGVTATTLKGEIGMLFSYGDELNSMKIAHTFAKDHKAFQIRGGMYEYMFLDAAHVTAMAKLPGRTELLARLVGSLRSPLVGMVNVVQGNLRGLVQVLHARSQTLV